MKLIKILQHLDEKTRLKSLDFFNSPYFKISSEISEAFHFITKEVKFERSPTKEQIWQHIYPNKKYDDLKLRKVIHHILTKLEDFFAIENTLIKENKRIRSIAEFIQKDGMGELKNKLQKMIKETIDKDNLPSSESYYDLYTTSRYILDIESDFEKKKDSIKVDNLPANLIQLNNLLDSAYIIEKIRLILLQNNYAAVLGENTVNLRRELIDEILIVERQNKKLLSLYYLLYDLLIKENDEFDLDAFVEILEKITIDNKKEANQIYDYLNNYFTRKLNKGIDVRNEIFTLMKFGLNNNLLIIKGRIDPTDYRNVMIVACRLNEFEWALNFVDEFKDHLAPEYRQSAYSFNKARIFMNMNRYDDAVDMLRDVEYEDITYNMNSKLMLMHAFYELDEYDVLESTIKAFKVFLRRRRNISKSRKANFTDHCDVLYNIIKASERRDPKRLTKALEILQQNSGIPNKDWLKERIGEISQDLGVQAIAES